MQYLWLMCLIKTMHQNRERREGSHYLEVRGAQDRGLVIYMELGGD